MAVPTMSRETLFAVCGLGGVVVTAALAGYLLGVQVGLGVGVLGAVAVAIGVGLYRHISHLRDQQKALEQQVEQQHEKTTSYRRQFEKTQNQLQAVKDEISATPEDSSESTDSVSASSSPASTDETTAETDPTTATEVAESAAAIQQPAASETTPTATEPKPPAETPTDSPATPDTPAMTRAESPSLATVVEESWKTVDTHSVVLEIADSQPLQADTEQLKSTLRDLIRAVVAEQTGDRQVFTSRAIALRAEHRNPQSDVTIQNDGGYTPQREATGRRVLRVGATDSGIYVDCTAALVSGNGKQEDRLEVVQRQIRDYGWTLSVSRRDGGRRIEIDQNAPKQRRPAKQW
jgi:type II secretory pathway pseudopilin PulG